MILSKLNKLGVFYGWVIVASCLVMGSTIAGIRFSFGVFFKSLENEFGLTRTATSIIFSSHTFFSAVFVIVGGWTLDRYGPRLVYSLMGIFIGLSLFLTALTNSFWQIFLSYSVLFSIGTAATMTAPIISVSSWFDKDRALAIGIATSGVGIGMLVIVPIAAYLISELQWRMSYALMGVVALSVIIPCAMLIKREPRDIGASSGEKATRYSKAQFYNRKIDNQMTGFSLTLKKAFFTKNFWLLMCNWLLYGACISLIITHIVPYAIDTGISVVKSSIILSIIGSFHVFSKIVIGRVSDLMGRRLIGIACASLSSGALIWLTWAHELWMFYLFAIVFGISWGGLGVINLILPSEIFYGRSLGVILGALEVGFLTGMTVGSAFGGLIFDITRSYVIAYNAAAAAMLLIALLIAYVRSVPLLKQLKYF